MDQTNTSIYEGREFEGIEEIEHIGTRTPGRLGTKAPGNHGEM
jgi:hypothetical protein